MNYAEMVKQAKEDRIFKAPDGEYDLRLKDWKAGTSNKGNAKITLYFKVLGAPSAEAMDKITARGRDLYRTFTMSVPYHVTDLLEFMQDAGVDLETITASEDNKDIKDALETLLDIPPKCVGVLKRQEDPQYYNLTLKEVTNVLDGTSPASPVPTKPAPAKPTGEVTVDGYTYQDMLDGEWTDEDLLADPKYACLVPVKKAPPKKAPAKKAPAKPAPKKVEDAPAEDGAPVKPY